MTLRSLGAVSRRTDTAKVGTTSRTRARSLFTLGVYLHAQVGLSLMGFNGKGHCFKTVMFPRNRTWIQPPTWTKRVVIYPSRRRTSRRCLVHSMHGLHATQNWMPKNYNWQLKWKRMISKALKIW